MLAAAWYRFRATFHVRWSTYLTIVLLIGVIGGLAIGALTGARRSESAFPDFLTSSKASDLQLQIFNPGSPSGGIEEPDLTGRFARLPHVQHAASTPGLILTPLDADGRPDQVDAAQQNVSAVGSRGGEYFTQDRLPLVAGRRADPGRTDQFMTSAEAARLSHWRVGQRVMFGAYTVQQVVASAGNTSGQRPATRFTATLTGLVVFPNQLVRDDVDRFAYDVLFTPALTQRLRSSNAFSTYALRLQRGTHDVPAVESEVIHSLSNGSFYNFHLTSVAGDQVERATRPEAIALGTFGFIAALAALLIAGQVIAREVRASRQPSAVLRSLGARPFVRVLDSAFGPLGAVVAGGLLAVVVGVALTPLAPLGPAGQVDTSTRVTFDWTVLVSGLLVFTLALGTFTLMAARRNAPRVQRAMLAPGRRSLVGKLATDLGLPEPAVTGLRFAFGRGDDVATVPARSMVLAAVVAVTIVVATVTFGSSLANLDTHPALYGWNWDYAVAPVANNGTNLPPATSHLLDGDADVAAWTDYQYANFQLDGQTVPSLISHAHAALNPPLLSGHGLQTAHDIVVGAATLAQLHKHVGDTVALSYGSPRDAPIFINSLRLRIVGSATLPTIGSGGNLHTSMGTGAIVSAAIEPLGLRAALVQPDPNDNGPSIYVVRLKAGVPAADGLTSLRRVAKAATRIMNADPNSGGGQFEVLSVQRPAEIINYESSGATPLVVAVILAAGAAAALALTLVAGVRNRRRELAVLKTLGYTRLQIAGAVAWQASVTALVGVLIGVPLGIAAGRTLWNLFARSIDAVPQPTVPPLSVLGIALGAMLLATIVAIIPARLAARTPPAPWLRTE